MALSRNALGHITGFVPLRSCDYCGGSMAGKRPQARWCSPACANKGWHLKQRREALLRRPRCIICDAPIRYGQTGVRLTKTRTCGSKDCRVKAKVWFGKMTP